MSKWQVLILVSAFALVAGSISCGGQSGSTTSFQPSSEPTVVSIVSGEVMVMKAGTNTWSEVSPGTALRPGDRIKTGPGSNAVITFFEGSTIELAADTEVDVAELGIAEMTGSTAIKLRQQIGKTTSRVKKLVDPASHYEIETPDGAAVVRGSVGDVLVTEGNSTTIINRQGQWSAIFDGREISIPQGYQITFVHGQLTTPVPVPVPPPPILPPPATPSSPQSSRSPLPLPISSSVPPSPQWQTWTQTTVNDFNAGARDNVTVIDVGFGDGTLILSTDTSIEVLDQVNRNYSANNFHTIYGSNYRAQTFRAGVTGNISKVALYLQKISGRTCGSHPLFVELRNCVDVAGDIQPGDIVYTSGMVINVNMPAEYQIAFVKPYTVFAGRDYAIVLYQQVSSGGDKCCHRWYEDPAGSYSNGMMWQSSDGGASWTKVAGGTPDFYFATYVNGHRLSGTLESVSYDCDIGVEFGTISWDSQTPGVTDLRFQIATNNDGLTWSFVGPDGTSTTYYETSGAGIWSGHDGRRYIRYKAYLRTTDSSQTPEFEEIRITYR
jgi:hypothetical protein